MLLLQLVDCHEAINLRFLKNSMPYMISMCWYVNFLCSWYMVWRVSPVLESPCRNPHVRIPHLRNPPLQESPMSGILPQAYAFPAQTHPQPYTYNRVDTPRLLHPLQYLHLSVSQHAIYQNIALNILRLMAQSIRHHIRGFERNWGCHIGALFTVFSLYNHPFSHVKKMGTKEVRKVVGLFVFCKI